MSKKELKSKDNGRNGRMGSHRTLKAVIKILPFIMSKVEDPCSI